MNILTNIVILLILTTNICKADEAFMSYGLGVFKSAEERVAETKVATIGYRKNIFSSLDWQLQVGYYSDASSNVMRNSSLFGTTGPQFSVQLSAIVVRSGLGVVYINSPDSYLGGRFPQFTENLYLGLRDVLNASIGLNYSHVSSAGIFSKNIGRDFITLELAKKF